MSKVVRKFLVAVSVVSLSAGVTACGSSESDGRNAAVVAGTSCKKSGEYKKVSGQKVVCGKSAGRRIWYGVSSVKKTKCPTLGAVRLSSGVAFVCGANKSAKVWMATKALSAANTQVATGQILSTGPATQADSVEPPTEVLNTIAPAVTTAPASSAPTASTAATAATSATPATTAVDTPITLDPRESNGGLETTTTIPAGITVGRGARAPGPYATDINVRQVASTNNATCAIDTVGTVWCWGYNDSGQLGNGTLVPSSVPVRNRIFDGAQHKAVKVVGGISGDFCALDSVGGVWCWGNGSSGSLGNGMRASSATPVQVNQFDGIADRAIDLSGDWGTYCVIDTTKHVWCWGASWAVAKWGNLNNRSNALSPVSIAGMETHPVTSVAVGMQTICAVDTVNFVWCWGGNTGGALGIGDAMNISDRVPTRVVGSMREDFIATQVVASMHNFCALQRNNRVRCWGADDSLRGSPGVVNDGTPKLVTALAGDIPVKSLEGAGSHMCIISTLGKLLCWGGQRVADPAVHMGYDGVAKQARSLGKFLGATTVLNVVGRLEIITSSSLELEGQGFTGSIN